MHEVGTMVARSRTLPLLAILLAVAPTALEAQAITGRVLDARNSAPVTLAAVNLVDRDRDPVALAMADSTGRYILEVPDSGEYVLVVQRFGYLDFESPLLAISDDRSYELDLELTPEPLGLGGLTVTVRNEEVVDWLRREFGVNPAQLFGFRVLQGERLAEAKAKGRNDPTETLRWLWVPVSHGLCVSINSLPRAQRTSGWSGPRDGLFGQPGNAPAGTVARDDAIWSADDAGVSGCGTLMVNDRVVPNEHLDSIDMSSIAVVVTLPGSVRMYTYDFDWTFRPRQR